MLHLPPVLRALLTLPDQHTRQNLPWAISLALLVAVVHLPIILGQSMFFNDITEFHVPLRHFFGQAWAKGQFPLWAPGIYTGFPLFAEGQVGPLYPPNWLFALLPAWYAYGILFVGHLALAAVCTFYFLTNHLSRPAAFIGGAVFGLTGFLAVHHMHINIVQAAALTAAAFATFEKMVQTRRVKYLALTALALGLMALAGHPQTTIQGGMALAIYGIARIAIFPSKQIPKLAAFFVAAILLGAAMYIVHLIPAMELARDSVRAEGLAVADQMGQHITLQSIVAAVVPSAFGSAGMDTAWLNPGGQSRPMLDIYMGIAVVILGLLSLRQKSPWVIFTALFVLIALGPLTLGIKEIYRLPIINSLRFPDRFNLQIAFFASFAAAGGVEAVLSKRIKPLDIILTTLAVVIPTLLVLALTYRNGIKGPLKQELIRDLVIAAVALGVLIAAALLSKPRTSFLLLAIATILPLADFGHRQVPTIDPSYWDTPNTVKAILAARDAQKPPDQDHPTIERQIERVAFRKVPTKYLAKGWLLDKTKYQGAMESLIYNQAMLYDLHSVDGIVPLRSREFLNVYQPIYYDNNASFGLFGARWLVTAVAPKGPQFRQVLDGPISVWEDKSALPRAYAVHSFQVETNPKQRVSKLLASSDLASKVFLSKQPTQSLPRQNPNSPPSTVTIDKYEHDHVVLKASMMSDGFVVLSDREYPGWQATVDGNKTEILRANHIFRAVYVPQGTHTIEYQFRPSKIWAFISLIAVLLIISLLIFDFAVSRKGLEPPPTRHVFKPAILPAALTLLLWLTISIAVNWNQWLSTLKLYSG